MGKITPTDTNGLYVATWGRTSDDYFDYIAGSFEKCRLFVTDKLKNAKQKFYVPTLIVEQKTSELWKDVHGKSLINMKRALG